MIELGNPLTMAVRDALTDLAKFREVRMFGGIGFTVNGNLVAASSKRGLLVRVGKELHDRALERKGTRPMLMKGRAVEGYVFVDPRLIDSRELKYWLRAALAYVQTLPPKKPHR